MMILWSVERTGSGSLPTFVGRYRQFRRAFPAEGVRVVARVTEAGPHKARADVDFLDDRGQPVARIEDYECVIDASLKAAFRRNRAAQARVEVTCTRSSDDGRCGPIGHRHRQSFPD